MTQGSLIVGTLLTLVPIVFIFILLVKFKVSTHISALLGLIATAGISIVFFHTSFKVCLASGFQGALVSLPVSMMVLLSIFQITYMERVGAISRISVFIKTLSPRNREAQIMMVNLSTGTTLVSMGATPVSVLPPIMKGLGYDNRLCISLPAVGFDALCTYSMMAAPMVTYCDLTGVSLVDAAKVFSLYLPIVSTLICFGMYYLVGGWPMMKKGFVPAILTGVSAGGTAYIIAHVAVFQSAIILSGVIAGIVSLVVMLAYLRIRGEKIIDRSVLTEEDLKVEQSMSLGKALTPWIIMIVCLMIVAFVNPVDQFLRVTLACPVSIIPGTVVNIRPVWNAYFWVLFSTLLSMLILKPKAGDGAFIMKKWMQRAIKPVISTVLFFMMGYLLNYSGFHILADGTWSLVNSADNMINVLAEATSIALGSLYPIIAAPLGMFGGFITSSEASALAMFAKYNILTGEQLGLNPIVITAATGIGAGLASVISPAKLQNAAATIDALGEENEVLRHTFKIAIALIIAVSALCWFFC